MSLNVVQVFGLCAVNVAWDIEVVVVGLNFNYTYHARIFRQFDLLVEDIYDLVNISMTQTVLVAILYKTLAGINHEDTTASCGVFLVENDNTGRDASTVEQVGR